MPISNPIVEVEVLDRGLQRDTMEQRRGKVIKDSKGHILKVTRKMKLLEARAFMKKPGGENLLKIVESSIPVDPSVKVKAPSPVDEEKNKGGKK